MAAQSNTRVFSRTNSSASGSDSGGSDSRPFPPTKTTWTETDCCRQVSLHLASFQCTSWLKPEDG